MFVGPNHTTSRFVRIVFHLIELVSFIALISLSFLTKGYAANDNDRTINFVVDAFAEGGRFIGIPISRDEVQLVKPLIRCVTNGDEVLFCTKQMVIEQVIGQLPQGSPNLAQNLVNCIAKGTTVDDCAKTQAIAQLPPQARDLANCIASAPDITSCGKLAISPAEKSAFATLNNLKGDAVDEPFKQAAGPIQNIIKVVDGVVHEDWEAVITNGGKAVAVVVVNQVIADLLTPATAYITGPIINTVVSNRIDLVVDLKKALGRPPEIPPNVPELSRIILEAYLVSAAEIPCALIPDGAVKEAICGTLGKIIQAIGSVASDVTDAVLNAVGDALHFLGIGDLIDDIGHIISGKDDNCASPEGYYSENFLMCYHRAAFVKFTDPSRYDALENKIFDDCHSEFFRCNSDETATRICEPLRDMFHTHVQLLHDALQQSAKSYARSRRPGMVANRSRLCSPGVFDAETDGVLFGCQNVLRSRYPLVGDATSDTCRPPQAMSFTTPDVYQSACKQAADPELKRIGAEICEGAGKCFPIKPNACDSCASLGQVCCNGICVDTCVK